MLTSAPHDPYRLPARVAARVSSQGLAASTDEERYARLVEAEDHMLGSMIEALERRGVLDSTIVVVVGDHGEGFGAMGCAPARQ